MKISKLIQELNEMKENYGDLDVLDNECFPVICASVEIVENDNDFPKTYDMPKGFTFARMLVSA